MTRRGLREREDVGSGGREGGSRERQGDRLEERTEGRDGVKGKREGNGGWVIVEGKGKEVEARREDGGEGRRQEWWRSEEGRKGRLGDSGGKRGRK